MKRSILIAALPVVLTGAEVAAPVPPAFPEAGPSRPFGAGSAAEAFPAGKAMAPEGRVRPDQPMTCGSGNALPAYEIYHSLFRQVLALDEQADFLDQEGRAGYELRGYFQELFGLNDPDMLALRHTAQESEWLLAKENERGQAFRVWYMGRFDGSEPLTAEAWQEIWDVAAVLRADRVRIMINQVQRLFDLMGRETTERFDGLVRQDAVGQLTITRLDAPTL